MQLCAGFEIKCHSKECFSAVVNSVNQYFENITNEGAPEYFEYWIKDLRVDEKRSTISVMSDVHAEPWDYEGILSGLIIAVAEENKGAELDGYYDLSDDEAGPDYHYFSASNGSVNWEMSNDDDPMETLTNLLSGLNQKQQDELVLEFVKAFSSKDDLPDRDSYAECLCQAMEEEDIRLMDFMAALNNYIDKHFYSKKAKSKNDKVGTVREDITTKMLRLVFSQMTNEQFAQAVELSQKYIDEVYSGKALASKQEFVRLLAKAFSDTPPYFFDSFFMYGSMLEKKLGMNIDVPEISAVEDMAIPPFEDDKMPKGKPKKKAVSVEYEGFKLTRAETGWIVDTFDGREQIVEIPAEIEGCPVTEIGPQAFSPLKKKKPVRGQLAKVKVIRMPSSIHTLGAGAFASCTGLEEISLSDAIVALPEPTTFENGLFQNCAALEEICLPAKLESIGSNAFMGCNKLKKISIPPTVTSIGDRAFSYCFSLQELILPPHVTVINEFTYSGEMYGSSIKRLVLPEDIVELKDQSFSFCRQLSEVVMPDRYIKWGFQSIDPESKWFRSFETNVADPALVLAYAGKNVIGYCGPFGGKYTDLYIKDGTVGIPPLTFSYVNVQTIHIPASVTEIGYNNFNSKQTIAAPKGSFAEKYAIENNLQYKPE